MRGEGGGVKGEGRSLHFAEVGEGNESAVQIVFLKSKQCLCSTVHLVWIVP